LGQIVGGNDDHRYFGQIRHLPQLSQYIPTVNVGQPQVQQYGIGRLLLELFQSFAAGKGCLELVAPAAALSIRFTL